MHLPSVPLTRSVNNIKMLVNPLPGSEIGIPLFFLEKTLRNSKMNRTCTPAHRVAARAV